MQNCISQLNQNIFFSCYMNDKADFIPISLKPGTFKTKLWNTKHQFLYDNNSDTHFRWEHKPLDYFKNEFLAGFDWGFKKIFDSFIYRIKRVDKLLVLIINYAKCEYRGLKMFSRNIFMPKHHGVHEMTTCNGYTISIPVWNHNSVGSMMVPEGFSE